MKLLILSTGTPSKYLTQAITDAGHTYETHDPRNLYLFISEQVNGYDRIFNGSPELESPVRLFAASFDAVISRIGAELPLCVSILRHLNENLTVYSPQTAIGLLVAHDKLWTSQVLSAANVRTPLTVFAMRANHVAFAIDKAGGLPVVAKQLTGSQGSGVSILETPLAANTTMESFHRANIPVKLQRFVKAHDSSSGKPTDIRAIVIGDEVVSAMERTASQGDFRANLSKGGNGRSINLSGVETEMCIKAAKAVGLEFAGVDLIREKMGQTYVTEVNGNPGTGIIDITKKNHFIDLVKYIQTKCKESDTLTAPVPLPDDDKEDKQQQENEEEASIARYQLLLAKEQRGSLDYNENAILSFFKRRFGKV
ncbi:ATP-grasp domain-containing protein [Spirosoma rhododendri]|uniref:RimK family alpha-L-glutamate ligase n=1 Tax=Spirosoma rhododendri TaxID=2728024 RepID=A0A7L5DVL4_9BACT|nr:RimK family alpha-L-glutamate ligase [Spirosoma rhododendri]QJD79590.1 RimK family alpha-L-glutamate ligase [Spirosoma rhododendri]